jgi:hypothetical protein
VGQGFSFSGGGYLTAPVATASTTGTIEGWVQTAPSMYNYDVFGLGSGPLTQGIVALSLGSTMMWQPELLYNTQTVLGPMVNAAAWNHVAFTWDLTGVTGPGPSIVIYVNGQAVPAVPSVLDAGIPQMLLMGGDAAGSANMTGLLDEVTLYSSVLSSSQITGIYAAGTTGKCQCRTAADCSTSKPTCNASGICQ